MKNFWVFIGITVALLGGAFLFINWNTIKEKVSGGDTPGGTGNNGNASGGGNSGGGTSGGGTSGGGTSGGGSSSGVNYNRLLKKGVYNSNEVMLLQTGLNKVQPNNPIAVDGDFGQMTEAKSYSVTGKRELTLGQFYLQFPWAKN